MDVTPSLLWDGLLGRVDVAVAQAGGHLHGWPAVVARDGPGTVAGKGALLGERVGHRHSGGVSEFLIREEEAAEREMAVHRVRGWRCRQATVQGRAKSSALAPGSIS